MTQPEERTIVEMSYDEWVETYKPMRNPFTDNGFDGTMFETYGQEEDFIDNIDPLCVWTWCSGDGDYITEGKRFVNRMGYFVTENPYKETDYAYIRFDNEGEN